MVKTEFTWFVGGDGPARSHALMAEFYQLLDLQQLLEQGAYAPDLNRGTYEDRAFEFLVTLAKGLIGDAPNATISSYKQSIQYGGRDEPPASPEERQAATDRVRELVKQVQAKTPIVPPDMASR